MKDSMTHLSTRVPTKLIEALDECAKERRMQTGENVNRADVVREALENMVTGKGEVRPEPGTPETQLPLLTQSINCPDEREAMRLALDAISQLARDAQQRGLLIDPPQDMGMTVWSACDGRKDLHLITDYVSKLHGALRAL